MGCSHRQLAMRTMLHFNVQYVLRRAWDMQDEEEALSARICCSGYADMKLSSKYGSVRRRAGCGGWLEGAVELSCRASEEEKMHPTHTTPIPHPHHQGQCGAVSQYYDAFCCPAALLPYCPAGCCWRTSGAMSLMLDGAALSRGLRPSDEGMMRRCMLY